MKKAYSYSQRFGCGLAIVAKQRKSGSEVEAYSLVGDVEGKDVIMIDDLTSTCGTLCAAANLCAKFGAASVHAAVTHSQLDDTGLARLRDSAITELIVTDTVRVFFCGLTAALQKPVISEEFMFAILRFSDAVGV